MSTDGKHYMTNDHNMDADIFICRQCGAKIKANSDYKLPPCEGEDYDSALDPYEFQLGPRDSNKQITGKDLFDYLAAQDGYQIITQQGTAFNHPIDYQAISNNSYVPTQGFYEDFKESSNKPLINTLSNQITFSLKEPNK